MFSSKIEVVLSVTGIAVRAMLIGILVRRHLQRVWTQFFLYCCYSILAEIAIILSATFLSYKVYFLVNFACQLVYVALGLLAMNEAFDRTFAVYYEGRKWFRFLVPTVVLIVMAVSATKWFRHVFSADEIVLAAYLSSNLGGVYSRAAVFGLFGVLVFFWQPSWQQHPFAIMKGFGLFSIVGMLANLLLRSDFGTKMNLFFAHAPSVAYMVACLIWLGGFLEPEPEKPARGPGSLVNVAELRELLERLTRAIR